MCLNGQIELMNKGETRQGQSHASGFFQRQTHIFHKMIDEESRIEIALQNAGRKVIERPASGRAALD